MKEKTLNNRIIKVINIWYKKQISCFDKKKEKESKAELFKEIIKEIKK